MELARAISSVCSLPRSAGRGGVPIPSPQAGRGRRGPSIWLYGIGFADIKRRTTMTCKVIGSIVALVLACSAATAADIRRVVTALGANDKAIALFDSRVTLEPGSTPSAKLWGTDTAPAGLSFTDDSGAKPTALPPDLGTALLVVEFPPLDPAEEAPITFIMKLGSIFSRSANWRQAGQVVRTGSWSRLPRTPDGPCCEPNTRTGV